MISSRTANSFEMIMVGRFLYGINAGNPPNHSTLYFHLFYFTNSLSVATGSCSGVGLSAQAMYLTESSPKNLRAMVGVTIATALAIGKFCGQLLGIR